MEISLTNSKKFLNHSMINEFDSLLNSCLDNDNYRRNYAEKILRFILSVSIKNYMLNMFGICSF